MKYRNPMSYRDYKGAEQNLKDRFPNNAVRVEPIDKADVYYTDGDASASTCKLIFTGGNTVYVPQLIYNVNPEHKVIIQEWMEYAANRGTPLVVEKPEVEAPVVNVAPNYCPCFSRKKNIHKSKIM